MHGNMCVQKISALTLLHVFRKKITPLAEIGSGVSDRYYRLGRRAFSGFIKLKSLFFVQIDTPIAQPYYEKRNGRMRLFSQREGPLELQRKRHIHKIICKARKRGDSYG